MLTCGAIDIGASSGRMSAGIYDGERIRLREITRFTHETVFMPHDDGVDEVWDIPHIWTNVVDGLKNVGDIASVGIDTWAVDYGRIDSAGRLIGLPESYRSRRTLGIAERTQNKFSKRLQDINGLQIQNFNTIFQLISDLEQERISAKERLLLLPDLFCYWLTGERICEITNASTTGLLDPWTREWAEPIQDYFLTQYSVDFRTFFAPLVEPGQQLGKARIVGHEWNEEAPQVISVGSQDTASAVAGIPTRNDSFCFISCGTWALVGVELDQPLVSEEVVKNNFTNEIGVNSTVRFLKNIPGMWIRNGCVANWTNQGYGLRDIASFELEAERLPANRFLFNVFNVDISDAKNMISSVTEGCRKWGDNIPRTPAEILRSIYDSLAFAFGKTIEEACSLSNKKVDRIHIVGGGSQIATLCQSLSNLVNLPVVAGPVEATTLGNLGVQLQSLGVIDNDLYSIRRVIEKSVSVNMYYPID